MSYNIKLLKFSLILLAVQVVCIRSEFTELYGEGSTMKYRDNIDVQRSEYVSNSKLHAAIKRLEKKLDDEVLTEIKRLSDKLDNTILQCNKNQNSTNQESKTDLTDFYNGTHYRIYDCINNNIETLSREKLSKTCQFPNSFDNFYTKQGDIVIQQRQNDKTNFNRSWSDYKLGFGSLEEGNFWIGNEVLHLLTNKFSSGLRLDVETFDGTRYWARYESFKISSENNGYKLSIEKYSGTASNSLEYFKDTKFSTYDVDNDDSQLSSLSQLHGGGWWFFKDPTPVYSNLNGNYFNSAIQNDTGIIWSRLTRDSLAKTQITLL